MARLGATASKLWKSSATIKLTPARSQLIRRTPLQWVIVALVKALNVVAIEALVTDLHPGTQRTHGRKFLDGEPDRLRCGHKAAIAQRLSWPALALAHEQLSGYAVVECHGLAVLSRRFAFMLNSITEIDQKGLFGRHESPCRLLATERPCRGMLAHIRALTAASCSQCSAA